MKKNRFKQKSFSTALYVTLGMLAIGAIAYGTYLGTSSPEVVPVDAMGSGNLQLQQPVMPNPVAQNIPGLGSEIVQHPLDGGTTADQQAGIREFFNQGQNQAVEYELETTDEISEPEPQAQSQAIEITPEPVLPVFNAFTGDTNLLWPVVGTVALEYSSESMIWDPTLELFARNDTLRIGTTVGEHVRAATDGIVLEISEDSRYGTTMTLDHGNGWTTTYNQLDGVTVSQGDVVATGQIIAVVAEPTRFTSGLGDNIGFRVMYNEDSVNPMTLLP